mmetsp:Transcript_36890/g.56475  ORF Transcript_36890/g.56475 Transcript_36890/m.56475 type:complete len:99 (+) Transcript_36890:2360-2656(+)
MVSSEKNSGGILNSTKPMNISSFGGSYPTDLNNFSETGNSSLSKHLKENPPLSSQSHFHGKRKHSHISNKKVPNMESQMLNYRENGQNKAWEINFNSK